LFNCTFTASHPETGGAIRSEWERANSPLPATFLPGTVISANSAAGGTGPQLRLSTDFSANACWKRLWITAGKSRRSISSTQLVDHVSALHGGFTGG